MSQTNKNISSRWLIAGAALGAALAASGLVENSNRSLPGEVIATVNGEQIFVAEYQGYLDALQQNRDSALDADARRHVLDRMIEERLLIQGGEQAGVLRSDAAARKALVDAVIENIVGASSGVQPDETTLRKYYEDNLAYFSQPPQLRVQRMVFRGDDALERAITAHEALVTGEAFTSVQERLADEDIMRLPGTPVPLTRLPNYLGPDGAARVSALQVGEITEPAASGSGAVLYQLLERRPGATPAFDDIRERVLRQYQRRSDDAALRRYLDRLVDDADIRINAAALAPKTGARPG